MRMPLVMGAICALAVLGCSGDPTKSRLPVGSEAIAVEEKGTNHDQGNQPEIVIEDIPEELVITKGALDFNFIPVGTKLRVIADDGPTDKYKHKVKVMVLEGKFNGIQGSVERKNLNPIAGK